jgi:hypothetical protein
VLGQPAHYADEESRDAPLDKKIACGNSREPLV